jgi:hypothetical protein
MFEIWQEDVDTQYTASVNRPCVNESHFLAVLHFFRVKALWEDGAIVLCF